MAEAVPSPAAPTSFAEFEAAGGKYNPAPAEPKTAEPVEAPEEPAPEGESEKATPEKAPEPERTGEPVPEKKPAPKAGKEKLSLGEEHAKLLREVTELRKQRRELQQPPPATNQPAPATEPVKAAVDEDKPPTRPKLSTYQGTLEEYEKAVDSYEEDLRKWQDRQFEKREAAKSAKAEQERITRDYGAKLADHLQSHPEYDAEIAQTPMSPLMVDIVLHHGPALGQALIDDKDSAKRIATLPRDIQIFEMGKLAAALHSANGRHVTEPEEAAPEPVKVPAKVGASGGSATALNRPDRGAKSFAEFEAIENRLRLKRSTK